LPNKAIAGKPILVFSIWQRPIDKYDDLLALVVLL
jgi:hypothetical protein